MNTLAHNEAREVTAAEYEAVLTRLWERNLGTRALPNDDYFDSGGDSLRGAQLLAWIHEQFKVELSLLDIFEHRTIAAQTRLLRSAPASDRSHVVATEYSYFGREGARLFGALHRAGANAQRSAVLLCYPIGQEYMRIHRSYVELAKGLSGAGHHVLRFDYFGCGDSAGEHVHGDLNRWAEDIRRSIEELRARTGVQQVYLVGGRIGANLVLDVGTAMDQVAGLVLWEPVVKGADYIASLRRAHHGLLDSNAKLEGYEKRELPGNVVEFIGYPFAKKLYDEVHAIDLMAWVPPASMPKILVLANSEKPVLRALAAKLGKGEACDDYVVSGESDGIWLKEDRKNKGLIPVHAIQAIISWISGAPK
jgi:pimeloyl-ACP methyl ester carboxylesterase